MSMASSSVNLIVWMITAPFKLLVWVYKKLRKQG